jgi:hypothetical protein
MTIDPVHNFGTCGGPRRCTYCQQILTASPVDNARRLQAEDHARHLVSASTYGAYTRDLVRLHAQASVAPSFEDRYKSLRAAEFAQARARMLTPRTPRLTTTELAQYAAPDPFKASIHKMRSEGR